jgi:hypothetical protein
MRAPRWVCWNVEQVIANGRKRGSHCDPAKGWHVEERPETGQVAVPDRTTVVRRYSTRD